jgi:glycine dehydrogenase subunit 1
MAHMGAGGMRAVAEVSVQRAHHLASLLTAIDGLSLTHASTPFLWEFVMRTPRSAAAFAAALRQRGIVAGLPLGRVDATRDDQILVCCTELTSPEAIERYAAAAADVVASERAVAMAHA